MTMIKIKYRNESVPKLKILEQGDWIDLAVAEDVEVSANEGFFVDLGVAMQLPEGYEAHILPRSSTFKKYGVLLTNSMGIIDASYNGDEDYWGAWLYGTKFTQIPAGTRILQFRLVKTMRAELDGMPSIVEVEHLSDSNRGGFGSTGN